MGISLPRRDPHSENTYFYSFTYFLFFLLLFCYIFNTIYVDVIIAVTKSQEEIVVLLRFLIGAGNCLHLTNYDKNYSWRSCQRAFIEGFVDLKKTARLA